MHLKRLPGGSRLAVSWFFLCCGLIFSSWAARIPVVKDAFDLNEAALGLVLFMLPLGSFIALPVAGWAVYRFGSRAMTLTGSIGYAAVLVLLGFSPGVVQLSITLFLFGFFGDLLNISMNTQGLAVQLAIRKPILSSLHAMWSVGALIGALVGGWSMRRDLSTQEHFMLVAMVCILFSGFCYLMMINEAREQQKRQKLFVLPEKALWLLGLICFCTAVAEGAMADWSSLYYRQVLNDPGRTSTTGYTAFTFSMTIGRLFGDRLIQVLRFRNLLMLNGLLICVGLLIAIAVPVPFTVIIGYALVGLGVSSVIPIVYMLAARSKTMATSVSIAAVSSIGFTGFLSGPPIIGFIAHATGLRVALTLVALLGLIIFTVARVTRKSETWGG